MLGMQRTQPPIFFYMPEEEWPEDLSKGEEYYWSKNRSGKWNWTLQAHENLKNTELDIKLAQRFPNEGIILSHRSILPDDIKPNEKQLFVCIQADRPRHPYAQIHLMQNREGARRAELSLFTALDRISVPFKEQHAFVHNWPQPELIPRDSERGDKFENVVYMGRAKNLAPELKKHQWSQRLAEIGLNWEIVEDKEKWKDYRQVDAVLAARSFDDRSYLHKPANKLYNAWHAGVPAVLAPESAFRAERESDLDYIEVHSPEEAFEALRRLRENPEFREAMIRQGRKRAEETAVESLVDDWKAFLMEIAVPAYRTWCEQPERRRRGFRALRTLSTRVDRFVERVYKFGEKHEWWMRYARRPQTLRTTY